MLNTPCPEEHALLFLRASVFHDLVSRLILNNVQYGLSMFEVSPSSSKSPLLHPQALTGSSSLQSMCDGPACN